MIRVAVALIVAASAAFAWLMLPAPPGLESEAAYGAHANHAGDPAALATGVVVSVDRTANSVTIRHGPLESLGMGPMTMAFRAGDPATLDGIRPGDSIRFHADVLAGAFTATRIEKAD